jgi:hypothetical protein
MEKLSYCRHLGREWGIQLQLEAEQSHVEKVASNGGEIDETALEAIDSLAESYDFQAARQGVAFDEGRYDVLSKIASAFEDEGTDLEALYGEIKEAMSLIEEAAPVAASQEEDEAMFGELVKGAAEGLAYATGSEEITEDLMQTATNLVVGMLSDEGEGE